MHDVIRIWGIDGIVHKEAWIRTWGFSSIFRMTILRFIP